MHCWPNLSASVQNPVPRHSTSHPQPRVFFHSPQWLLFKDSYEQWGLKIKTPKATSLTLEVFLSSLGLQRAVVRLAGQNPNHNLQRMTLWFLRGTSGRTSSTTPKSIDKISSIFVGSTMRPESMGTRHQRGALFLVRPHPLSFRILCAHHGVGLGGRQNLGPPKMSTFLTPTSMKV